MNDIDKTISYLIDPKHKCRSWKWQHKDFTHLGMIGDEILAPPDGSDRGFTNRVDACRYAREYKQSIIEQRSGGQS